MKYINTPAGKFRILLNGKAADFEAKPYSPYTYHDRTGAAIPILACYQVWLNIENLSVGDVIVARYEHGTLENDGGGEGMDNAVGYVGTHVVGIGATDTEYRERDMDQRQLPYENCGIDSAGFLFRIVDDPEKYTAYSIQQNITFIVAWEALSNAHAWDIVSFMTS